MSVLAHPRAAEPEDRAPRRRRLPALPADLRGLALPLLVSLLGAIAFLIVRPDVNDLWAARARASAVDHGVGLTYWFSWFGGGSTPGNYSLITPYLSTIVGTVGLALIATVLVTPLAWFALRGTAHPTAGLWVATVTAGLNLWCGRVPFALGCALAVVSGGFVVRRRTWLASAFGVLAVAASPVSAAFLGVVLLGAFLSLPDMRRVCLLVGGAIGAAMVAVAVWFGQPGPESFTAVGLMQMLATLAFLYIAATPKWVRTTLWVSALVAVIVILIPNGMGDNLLRLAWYCLPALVIATSARRMAIAVLGVSLALLFASKQTVGDVSAGTEPTASSSYYTSLITELTKVRDRLHDYRLEVVEDGTHTAAAALIDHAMLARGYEYQEDNALNEVLSKYPLDSTEYKIWLDNNAVGLVAISSSQRKPSPEYQLVSEHRPNYLSRIWSNDEWTLYRVQDPTPIVRRPVVVEKFSQAELVLRVPCACSFTVRVRNPENLQAVTHPTDGSDPVRATIADDGWGWARLTTTQAGIYTLSGN